MWQLTSDCWATATATATVPAWLTRSNAWAEAFWSRVQVAIMPFHSSDGCLCVYRRRRLLISLAFYHARPSCCLLSSFPLSLWHSSLPCFILCGMRNNMKLMTFASMRFDMWQQAAFQLAVVRQTDRLTDIQADGRTDSHSFIRVAAKRW